MKNGKHRGQKKQKRKGAYDKSGGIVSDTAAFAFRTKDILKIRNRPRLEPGSDYHYLVQEMGLEPTHCCQRQILSLMRLPFRHSCIFETTCVPNDLFIIQYYSRKVNYFLIVFIKPLKHIGKLLSQLMNSVYLPFSKQLQLIFCANQD